jgi:hypothetical protein
MVQAGAAALLTLCCLGCAAGRRDSGLPEEAGTQRARALAELSGTRSAGEETDSELRSPREGSKLTSTSASEEIVPSDTRLGSAARSGAVPKDADAAKQMAAVLAELQAIGAVDPAAQERLLSDLRQIDPALWSQTIATARATIDYQRKTRSELAIARPQSTAPPQLASPATTSPTPSGVAQVAHLAPAASSATNGVIEPAVYRAPTSPPANAAVIPATATVTSASAIAPSPGAGPPHIPPPNTGTVETSSAATVPNAAPSTAAPPFASPATPAAMPAGLDAAIAALVSGDQPLPPSANSTAAAQSLEAAAARLRDAGPLGLTHLAFCTEVNSYGVYKPFEKFEFTAGQEVLLYAEVDGFKAEAQSEGFRTALSSNYEIVDAKGTTVDIRDFGLTEEVCRNRRRDYFIRYQFHLPQQLAVGSYTLRLKMTDGLSQKKGEATIDFSIKQK